MIFSEDYSNLTLWKKSKGIKRILQERGLWKEGLSLKYSMCKKKEFQRVDCCVRKIMASQPDFVTQKSAIVEVIENEAIYVFFIWSSIVNLISSKCTRMWPNVI